MEPQSWTPALQAQIDTAIAQIPPKNRWQPTEGEEVEDFEAGFRRIQDWAFVEGFAVVKESKKNTHFIVQCVHHKRETQNTRKIADGDRKRMTKTQATGCMFFVYISFRKTQGEIYCIGYTRDEHNHFMNPDPFTFAAHKEKKPKQSAAISAALPMRGEILYRKVSCILEKQGLKISKKEFYNFQCGESKEHLSNQKELTLLLQYLQKKNFHVHLLEKYVDIKGKPKKHIAKVITFTNSEMIRLAKKFVNQFVYMINATFGTNQTRLPLLVLVGINNTDTTFPFFFAYIVSESAETFQFVNNFLTEVVFFDVPGPAVCIGDWAAGLYAAMFDFNEQERVVAVEQGCSVEICQFQTCNWHTVEAIKAKLIRASKYSKKRRQEVTDLIWIYIKSNSNDEMQRNREKFVDEFSAEEQHYLLEMYQPKKHQFIQAKIKIYPNLGCNSMQHAEGYHTILKTMTDCTKLFAEAVRGLRDLCQKLAKDHDAKVNRNRKILPVLIDRMAFQCLFGRITHYVLQKVSREWDTFKEAAEKKLRGEEQGKQQLLELLESNDAEKKCQNQCKNPLKYSLPCRHILWKCYQDGRPIPPIFFHWRWFLDNKVHQPSDSNDEASEQTSGLNNKQWKSDRYHDQGAKTTYFHAQELADF